jgi:hypothetical protein
MILDWASWFHAGVSANLSNSGQGPLPCHVVKRSDSPWHFTLHQLCGELTRSRVFSQDDQFESGLDPFVRRHEKLKGPKGLSQKVRDITVIHNQASRKPCM